eukprot:gene25293-4629_t
MQGHGLVLLCAAFAADADLPRLLSVCRALAALVARTRLSIGSLAGLAERSGEAPVLAWLFDARSSERRAAAVLSAGALRGDIHQ